MAITIPRVQRIEPTATPGSGGPVNLQTPDLNQLTAPTRQLFSTAVKEVTGLVKYQEDREIAAGKIKALEFANAYEQDILEKTQGKDGIFHKKGDPSSVFNDFDDYRGEKIAELMGQANDFSAKTRELIQGKLSEVENRYSSKKTVQFGKQYKDYVDTQANTHVKLLSENLTYLAGQYDPSDPVSIDNFNQGIRNMYDVRKGQADEFNVPTEQTVLQFMNDVSPAVTSAVQGLIASGEPEKAEVMMQDNNQFIAAKNLSVLTEGIKKAKVKNNAHSLVRLAESYGEDTTAAMKVFNNSDGDLETIEKARTIYKSRALHAEQTRKIMEKESFDTLGTSILERMTSATPYVSWEQFTEENPDYERHYTNIRDVGLKQKLRKLIEKPKESSRETVTNMIGLVQSGEMADLTPQEFMEASSGLSASHFSKYHNLYLKMTSSTSAEERSNYGFMAREATTLLNSYRPTMIISGRPMSQERLAARDTFVSKMQDAAFSMMASASTEEKVKYLRSSFEQFKTEFKGIQRGEEFNAPEVPSNLIRRNTGRVSNSPLRNGDATANNMTTPSPIANTSAQAQDLKTAPKSIRNKMYMELRQLNKAEGKSDPTIPELNAFMATRGFK